MSFEKESEASGLDVEEQGLRLSRLGEELFIEFRRLCKESLPHEQFWTACAEFVVREWERRKPDAKGSDPVGVEELPRTASGGTGGEQRRSRRRQLERKTGKPVETPRLPD